MRAAHVDVDRIVRPRGSRLAQHFGAGDDVAELDHVGDQNQRNRLEEDLRARPADRERRHLGHGLADRRNQPAPLHVEVDFADQRPYDGGDDEARQQAERSEQHQAAMALLEGLERYREHQHETDHAGQRGRDRLLQQELLGIIDEDLLERGEGRAEDDPGTQGRRQPAHQPGAEPGHAEDGDEAGEEQGQRGHRLEALHRIRIAGDHIGQHQRQGRRVPARRVRFAEGVQRRDDEEAVEQRAGHRLLEAHAEVGLQHRHQGQPGRGRHKHALQELGPEQARVQERQAEGERTPLPAIGSLRRHALLPVDAVIH